MNRLLSAMILVPTLAGGCTTGGPAVEKSPFRGAMDNPAASANVCAAIGEAPDCDICELFDWYGDGECDDFCRLPDAIDCPAPVVAPSFAQCSYTTPSPLGQNLSELNTLTSRRVRAGDAINEDESTRILAATMHLGFTYQGQGLDASFAATDEQSFDLSTVVSNGAEYSVVSFHRGDTRVGVVFLGNVIITEISDGDLLGCEQVAPTCSYDSASTLPASYGELSTDSRVVLRVESDLTISQLQQLNVALNFLQFAEGTAFDVPDDKRFRMETATVEGVRYDALSFYRGDTLVGVLFAENSTSIVAEISDGELKICR